MEVTDIRLNLIDKEGAVKAIGSFSLDNAFAVRGVRVMEDKTGKDFVAFPSREKANGEYEDLAFPLSKEFYHKVTEAIVAEYNKTLEEKQNQNQAEDNTQQKNETETASTPKKGKSR